MNTPRILSKEEKELLNELSLRTPEDIIEYLEKNEFVLKILTSLAIDTLKMYSGKFPGLSVSNITNDPSGTASRLYLYAKVDVELKHPSIFSKDDLILLEVVDKILSAVWFMNNPVAVGDASLESA